MQFLSPNDAEFRQFVEFLKMPITQNFIELLAQKACATVRAPRLMVKGNSTSQQLSPPETPNSSCFSLPSICGFIRDLVLGSRVQPATLFGTMVYLERLKSVLPASVFLRQDAAHMVLVACLIIAGKFLNDAAPKNKHWANYAKIYAILDLNQMEHQILTYLQFDLTMSNHELVVQYRAFAHLPHSNTPMPIPSPLASNFPKTPKSAVFPPLSSSSRYYYSTSSQADASPSQYSPCRSCHYTTPPKLLSNVAAPYPSPLHAPSHFPLAKPTRISELSNSGSMLYRRRTTRQQQQLVRKSPSQLSLSVTSAACNQTLRPLVAVTDAQQQYEPAPLSAPLLNQFTGYTLRSNVPPLMTSTPTKTTFSNHHLTLSNLSINDDDTTTPLPHSIPPPTSAGMAGGFDPSLKLPPLVFPIPESRRDRLPPLLP